MALFFRGAVTSSPVKSRGPEADQSCSSLGVSFLSDSSYECFLTNPLTGSLCECRRSPRLLSNGYYVTEETVAMYDQGNLTLTPSKTNVSYKENLVRIFRRRRRARRSLASLLSDVSQSCQSWLEGGMFGRSDPIPLDESSWLEDSSAPEKDFSFPSDPEMDTPFSFSYDSTEIISHPDKMAAMQEEEPHLSNEQFSQSEACLSHQQFSQSLEGFLDVPPPTTFIHNSYCPPSAPPPDSALVKALFLLLLTLCLCTAIFSRSLLGGVAVAMTFLMMMLSFFFSKRGATVRWSRAKTEDITSRNE